MWEKRFRKSKLIIFLFLVLLPMTALALMINGIGSQMHVGALKYDSDIIAMRVVNSTKIHIRDPVNISTIINNPTTWVLKNISFSYVIPLDTEIILVLNNSPLVLTKIEENEEGYKIQVNISRIDQNSIFVHWIIVKFKKEGNYNIGSSDIYFVKQKGELIERGTITCPSISFYVYKYERPVPKEGEVDFSALIMLVTVIIPISILASAHKIAAKR